MGCQRSSWQSTKTAVFLNLRQKQQRKDRKMWKNGVSEWSEVVMDGEEDILDAVKKVLK